MNKSQIDITIGLSELIVPIRYTFKHMIISQSTDQIISNLRGEDWSQFDGTTQDHIVELCFDYWRTKGFPHYNLTDYEIAKDYETLRNSLSKELLINNDIQVSTVGLRIANFFQPQMWEVRVGVCRSPMERFLDDNHLRKIIRKAFDISKSRSAVNESGLRGVLRTYSKTTRVSNFRPTAAKAIFETFSKDGEQIVDFSAGYGGRLLGCLPLDRHYLGIDPCKKQINGMRTMVNKLAKLTEASANIKLVKECAEDFLPKIADCSVSLVFSSPPYFDLERYSSESSQSYIRYPRYAEWKEFFLSKIIEESWRILAPNKFLVINVANTRRHEIANDTIKIASQYFQLFKTLRLRLSHQAYLRKKSSSPFKYEPIFVFRKTF